MAADIMVPGGVLSLTAEAADRLLKLDSGDAVLLYLHLLRRGGPDGLRWPEERRRAAWAQLAALRLAGDEPPPAPAPAPPAEPPEYTSEDIARELGGASSFPALVAEVQRRLGGILTTADLKMLYTLYDFLALPAEVILLLVTWCVQEAERKYGAGRRPRLSQIRKEGFSWHRQGVDTVEGAEVHLKRLSRRRGKEGRWLALLDITGREAVEAERKYLDAWIDMGFEEEAVRLAYEKTVLKKQGMNWPYMNSILKSWHQKNLHTVARIREGDSSFARRPPAPLPGAAPRDGEAERRAREDMERMRRFLDEKKRQGEG